MTMVVSKIFQYGITYQSKLTIRRLFILTISVPTISGGFSSTPWVTFLREEDGDSTGNVFLKHC